MKRLILLSSIFACLALAGRPVAAADSSAPPPVSPSPPAGVPTPVPSPATCPALCEPACQPALPLFAGHAPEMFGDVVPSSPLALAPVPPGLASALQGTVLPQALGITPLSLAPPHTASGATNSLGVSSDPPVRGVVLVPSVGGFKVADNNSPIPTDRVYFSFNYFDNVNAAANRALGADIHNIRVYRETLGVELALFDGAASVALSAPLNSLSADSDIDGLGGSDTDLGDLTATFKYAFLRDPAGICVSSGLAVTAPTGPSSFAGTDQVAGLHSTRLQPFLAYYYCRDAFYVQGFSSIDIPTDARDVTMWYNDLGAGYWVLHRAAPDMRLTGLAPTLEVHVNNPLNHRGVLGFTDPAGTPDVVDLTGGLNFLFGERTRLGIGVATPLTGPKPFDIEAITQLRVSF